MREWGLEAGNGYVPQKGYFHADLERGGETVLYVSAEGDGGIPRGAVFLGLGMKMDSEESVRKAVSVLSEGTATPRDYGYSPCAASVTDPFNVNWFIYICLIKVRYS